MINLVRLDERLLHGQVAIKWSRHLDIDRILICNDEASKNEIIQKSLLMAAPQNIKVAIKDLKTSIKILNDDRMAKVKVLVIISRIEDLLNLVKNVEEIKNINIGNYGRIAAKNNNEQRKRYRSNLYLYSEEKDNLLTIIKQNKNVIYQTIPDDNPEKLSTILE